MLCVVVVVGLFFWDVVLFAVFVTDRGSCGWRERGLLLVWQKDRHMVGEQQLNDLCMSLCSCGSEEDVVVHSRIGEKGEKGMGKGRERRRETTRV